MLGHILESLHYVAKVQLHGGSHWRCSIKEVSLKVSQYSYVKTPVLESLFNNNEGVKALLLDIWLLEMLVLPSDFLTD